VEVLKQAGCVHGGVVACVTACCSNGRQALHGCCSTVLQHALCVNQK
jgi:hypothetical protein